MKTFIGLALLAGLAFLSPIFADGESENFPGSAMVMTDWADLKGFREISNQTSADVIIQPREDWNVEVTGPEAQLGRLGIAVRCDALIIMKKSGLAGTGWLDDIRISISLPELRSLRVNDSGDATVQKVIETEHLTLHTNGSGNIIAQARSESLAARTSGSGNLTYLGTPDEILSRETGSGRVRNAE